MAKYKVVFKEAYMPHAVERICDVPSEAEVIKIYGLKELETPDDLTILTDRVWKIYNEINNLGDNEQILLCRGEYYDTIPIKTTRYHIDVYERMIAVVDHETDEDYAV